MYIKTKVHKQSNKMNEKYTAGTFLKLSMEKSYKDVKLIPPSTKIHNRSRSWLVTGTSITQNVGVKLVLWAQIYPLR